MTVLFCLMRTIDKTLRHVCIVLQHQDFKYKVTTQLMNKISKLTGSLNNKFTDLLSLGSNELSNLNNYHSNMMNARTDALRMVLTAMRKNQQAKIGDFQDLLSALMTYHEDKVSKLLSIG